MSRVKRKPKVSTEPVFVPVHAASMSTPIFAELARQLGDPDLNPCDPDEEISFAQELADIHTPQVSVRELLPAWVENTGQYLVDQVALRQWQVRIAGDKADKEMVDARADSGGS